MVEQEGGLHEIEGELSSPSLGAYFERLGVFPSEGSAAEVNLGAGQWLREASNAVEFGYFLLLDYGYPAERLYAPWRRKPFAAITATRRASNRLSESGAVSPHTWISPHWLQPLPRNRRRAASVARTKPVSSHVLVSRMQADLQRDGTII